MKSAGETGQAGLTMQKMMIGGLNMMWFNPKQGIEWGYSQEGK